MANQRIDSISVGLGIDASSLHKDIQGRLDGFTIQPRLVRPSFQALNDFVTSINKEMGKEGNANRLGVRLQVTFDENQAKERLGAIVDSLNASGLKVQIPIEYTYPPGQAPGGAGGPNAPAPQPAPSRGRGGAAAAPEAQPAAPAAASTATGAVAAGTVASAKGNVRTQAQANAAADRPVAAGAIAAAAVANEPPPQARPATAAAPAAGAVPSAADIQGVVDQAVQAAIATVMPSFLAAAQPAPAAAAPAAAPASRQTRPRADNRSEWEKLWMPVLKNVSDPAKKKAIRQVRKMMRDRGVDPVAVQSAVTLARREQPLPEHLAEYQPFYDRTRQVMEEGSTMRAANANRGARKPAKQEPMVDRLNQALAGGDWAAADTMFPGADATGGRGLGTLISQGEMEQATSLYFRHRYPNTPAYEEQRKERPYLKESRAEQVLGQRRGMFHKRWDVLAERYPLDFSLLSWTAMGSRWNPETDDEGSPLGWGTGYQPKIAGGAAGTSIPAKKPSRQRVRELTRDPLEARIELNTLRNLERTVGPTEESQERMERLQKEIDSYESRMARLSTPVGEVAPYPVATGKGSKLANTILGRMRELAEDEPNMPMGTPEKAAQREGLLHESRIYREWMAKQHPDLLKQFVSASASRDEGRRSWAAKLAQLPIGQELPQDAATNAIMSGRPHEAAEVIQSRMEAAAEVERQLARERAQKLGIKGVLGLQGGGPLFPGIEPLRAALAGPIVGAGGYTAVRRVPGHELMLAHDKSISPEALMAVMSEEWAPHRSGLPADMNVGQKLFDEVRTPRTTHVVPTFPSGKVVPGWEHGWEELIDPGRMNLLWRVPGEPVSIEGVEEDILGGAETTKQRMLRRLSEVSSMSQETYDRLAMDTMRLHRLGYSVDPGKSNNMLYDTQGDRFNWVDVHQGPYEPDASDLFVPMMGRPWLHGYGPQGQYRSILDKTVQAASRAGMKPFDPARSKAQLEYAGMQGGGVRLFPRKGGDPFGAFTDRKGDPTFLRKDWWMPSLLLGSEMSIGEPTKAWDDAVEEMVSSNRLGMEGISRGDLPLTPDLTSLYRSFGVDDPLRLGAGVVRPHERITAWGSGRGRRDRRYKGSLDLYYGDFYRSDILHDIFPFVPVPLRRRGIGSAMYDFAELLGLPAEDVSNINAAAGSQTEEGNALWRARKRQQGWSDDEILEQWMSLFVDDEDRVRDFARHKAEILAQERSGRPYKFHRPRALEHYDDGGLRKFATNYWPRPGKQTSAPGSWPPSGEFVRAGHDWLKEFTGDTSDFSEFIRDTYDDRVPPHHVHMGLPQWTGNFASWPCCGEVVWAPGDPGSGPPRSSTSVPPAWYQTDAEELAAAPWVGGPWARAGQMPLGPEWQTDPLTLLRNSREYQTDPSLRALVNMTTHSGSGIYHVTTQLESVRQHGLMSARGVRNSLGAGDIQGLGSHGSGVVSTTWSKARAQTIADILEQAGEAARGHMSPEDIADFYEGRFEDPKRALHEVLNAFPTSPSPTRRSARTLREWALRTYEDDIGGLGPTSQAGRDAHQSALWKLFTTLDSHSFSDPRERTERGVLFAGVPWKHAANISDVGVLNLASDRPPAYINPHELEMKFPPSHLAIVKEGLRAGGHRPSSLSDLPGVAANIAGITAVGEQGEEWIVRQHDGSEFVVPHHQLPHFRGMVGLQGGGEFEGTAWEGQPAEGWASSLVGRTTPPTVGQLESTGLFGRYIGRARRGRRGYETLYRRTEREGWHQSGMGIRDITNEPIAAPAEASAGAGSTPISARPMNRGVGPAGLRIMPGTGPYVQRNYAASLGAIGEGRASSLNIMSGSIVRVFVTNWPAGFEAGTAAPVAKPEEARAPEAKPPEAKPTTPEARAPEGTRLEAKPTPEDFLAGELPQRASIVPLAKGQAKVAARQTVADLRARLDEASIAASEALQKAPVRALSVAAGQIAQTIIGGRAGILSREKLARADIRGASQITGEFEAAVGGTERLGRQMDIFAGKMQKAGVPLRFAMRERYNEDTGIGWKYGEYNPDDVRAIMMNEAIPAKQKELLANLQQQQVDQMAEATYYEPIAIEAVAKAEASSKGILSPFQQLKAQTVGVGGIVGGTMLFTAAMQLAQFGMQAIGEAARPVVDAMLGFKLTLAEQTTSLAQAFQAAGGAPEGVYGGIVNTGMGMTSAAMVAGTVGELARRQQANENMRQQVALQRASRGTGFLNMTTAGLTQPTNGLFGTPVFATPSTLEQLVGELMTLPVDVMSRDIDKRGWHEGYLMSNANRDEWDAATEDILKANVPVTERHLPFVEETARAEALQSINQGRLNQYVNQQLEDKGFSGGVGQLRALQRNPISGRFSEEDFDLVEMTVAALEAFDPNVDQNQLRQLQEAGVYLDNLIPDDLAGNAKKIEALLTATNEAEQRSDRNVMLALMRPQLEAEMRSIQRERAFKETTLIPAQVAQQYLERPMPGMIGMPTTTGIISSLAGARERGLAAPYAAGIGSVISELEPLMRQGERELIKLGVDEEQIEDVRELGASITKLRADAGQLQLDIEIKQYNEQLFIAKRSLTDVLTILGKTQGATSELGRLQRAQISDQRELTRIQLARSQRELNMEVALSRLRAPGETAEERAVRMREAMVQARERQRELDINRGMAGRGFRMEDIGFERQARDLGRQVELLQESRDVTIEVRGMNQLAEAQEALLQVRSEYLNTAKEAGVEIRRMGFRVQTEIESRAGKFANLFATEVATVMGTLLDESTKALERFKRAAGFREETDRRKLGGEGVDANAGMFRHHPGISKKDIKGSKGSEAAGGIFDTLGATAFVAGEAGPERVVVMRNPRVGMTPPPTGMRAIGRGGSPVNISLNLNASVSNQADEDRLARKIARMLHNEAALLVGA